MRKLISILTIITLTGVTAPFSFAQEKAGISPIISVSKDGKTRIKAVQTIAIFLNGNDSLLTRVLEDLLGIRLTNAGFTVINREILEKSTGEQIAKKKKEKTEAAINALEIGAAVNANSILTGTVIVENDKENSFLIKIASFQLVDVASGKNLLSILFESEKGESFSKISNDFVNVLKQSSE